METEAFQDRVVLVTGAGRGIGRAVAERYALLGARVVLWDKDESLLQESSGLIRPLTRGHAKQSTENAPDERIVTHVVDLSQPSQIENAMALVAEQFGQIDIVINNAGVSHWKSPLDLTVREWDEVLNVNLRGTFLCSREAARYMPQGSAIVNVASTRGLMSEPNSEAYAASKGGILALTHALAASLADRRIRVNAISPGWIETGDYEALRPEDHSQHFAGRVGRPSDIAQACVYLTHPANDFVTGINLVVDGGMTRKMMYLE
ncbi:SDR family NAD(P)-dependent oxidoreductase [Alicyclobacillus mengziensis]|uniref:SDR family oxidoreductase n=1 Tax=Alicyclobacillus mengziensis TaxID=2931921 RepID=A0A9X7VYY2_9BACL|nr:SDR family oxidoreductase [Alicyclobacillus mengziensis]QSO47651.1 SDR family oxidoreductase [Alicyclobacillus mengziensis]